MLSCSIAGVAVPSACTSLSDVGPRRVTGGMAALPRVLCRACSLFVGVIYASAHAHARPTKHPRSAAWRLSAVGYSTYCVTVHGYTPANTTLPRARPLGLGLPAVAGALAE